MRKISYVRGQVVYVKSEGEYMRFLFLIGFKEATLFNPRWAGKEIHPLNQIRPLTSREKGASNPGQR